MVACDIYDQRKKDFPDVLKECKGMIATACHKAGIHRATYYRWKDEDPEFKEACDMAAQHVNDFVESKLLKLINDEVPAAVIFYCKTKMRDRGYAEYREEPPERQQKDVGNTDKEAFEVFLKHKISMGVEDELKRLGIISAKQLKEVNIEVKE